MTASASIDVLILCGGLGKRLKPALGEQQKVLAHIGKRPFLDILIDDLAQQGFQRFVLCAGFQSQAVQEYVRNKKSSYQFEVSREEKPLGTGGAIKNAEAFVRSPRFLALNGDSFCRLDIQKMVAFHCEHKALATIALTRVKDSREFGAIKIDDEMRITSFKEKDAGEGSLLINAGIYCFEKEIFPLMPPAKAFSIEHDFFPTLIGKRFYGFTFKARRSLRAQSYWTGQSLSMTTSPQR